MQALLIHGLGIFFVLSLLVDVLIIFCGYRWALHKKRLSEANEKKKQWVNIEVGNEVHTIPVNDKVAHGTEDACACSPQTVPVPREDGTVGWQIIHNALDGRL